MTGCKGFPVADFPLNGRFLSDFLLDFGALSLEAGAIANRWRVVSVLVSAA